MILQSTIAAVPQVVRAAATMTLALLMSAGADGRVYVKRTRVSKSDTQLIDVFDQQGRRSQFELPPNSREIAFGKSQLFVAIRGDDELESIKTFSLLR